MDLILHYFSKVILIGFGIFLIWSSYMMFFKSEKTKSIIALAGSTIFINFFELSIRCIVGFAFLNYFTNNNYFFNWIGYFLIFSAILIMFLPIKLHNSFSRNAANKLKPIYLKIASLISLIAGLSLIYTII
ncbi:hypothetical protein [Flavobacterium indicum]|nr:hypothetical protein [Flavobacterium indicum]